MVDMPVYMEKKTASAEKRTPKIPFKAQNQGVSVSERDFTNFIPIGKKIPRIKPSGNITIIDTIILLISEEVIMLDIV